MTVQKLKYIMKMRKALKKSSIDELLIAKKEIDRELKERKK